jgi:hypothetical protein
MLTAAKIISDIELLSEREYLKLVKWFSEKDWEKWDKQIEKDSQDGKLDFLIEEAMNEKRKGTLRNL